MYISIVLLNWIAGLGVAVADAEQVTELATAIKEAEHLIFDGLQAYQGSIQHELEHEQRKTELDVIERVKLVWTVWQQWPQLPCCKRRRHRQFFI